MDTGGLKLAQDLPKALARIFDSRSDREDLMLYAQRLARTIRGLGSDPTEAGLDAFQDTVEAVLAGRRTWNPEKQPDPYEYLKLVILSMLRNERDRGGKSVTLVAIDDLPPQEAERALAVEVIHEDDELTLRLLDRLKDDPEAYAVVEQIQEGHIKPQDIALALGVEANKVYVVKKRIKRQLDDLLKEQSDDA